MTRTTLFSAKNLLASAAAAALIAGAPAAFAQTAVTQGATNNSTVMNPNHGGPAAITIDSGSTGVGASASVGATGSITAVTVTNINGAAPSSATYGTTGPAGGFGAIGQTSTNTGGITNGGTIGTGSTTTGTVTAPNAVSLGQGASMAISATGAAASVGVTGIGSQPFTGTTTGAITQTTTNQATITNDGSRINNGGGSLGAGASASINASGAVSSVGVSYNGATTVTGAKMGNVTQTSTNAAIPAVAGTPASTITTTTPGSTTTTTDAKTGVITTIVINPVTTTTNVAATSGTPAIPTSINNQGQTISVGALSGDGASVGIRATGAAASVSLSQIGIAGTAAIPGTTTSTPILDGGGNVIGHTIVTTPGTPGTPGTTDGSFTVGNVKQTVANTGSAVRNGDFSGSDAPFKAPIIKAGDLSGAGSSASLGGTGAVASVSTGSIGSQTGGTTTIGTVDQSAINTDSRIRNSGSIAVGVLSGNGSSASISASGAVASVQSSAINNGVLGGQPVVGAINQVASNLGNSPIVNRGAMTVGGLTGTGASASISATGAAAVVSFSSVSGSVVTPK